MNFITHEKLDEIIDIFEDDEWEHWFNDSSTNPYLIKVIRKLYKNGVKTPGVLLVDILVPLGKKIIIYEDYHTGQYPVLVDI